MTPITRASLILMLKYPEPGRVKTRLIPCLGERRACQLYRQLVDHTIEKARHFAETFPVEIHWWIANADEDAVRQWLGPQTLFHSQPHGDLGQRMARAMRDAFDQGASSVVVIGADCPELTEDHLRAAFGALAMADLVLGPAADGGYYLIGMRRWLPDVFGIIEWGSERVLEQTLNAARQAGVKWQLLESLHDLDRPEDLPFWANSACGRSTGRNKISVVIPVLNEAPNLPQTLETVRRADDAGEIIVVDGGSQDETVEVARSLDAIVLNCGAGRARQMNAGAAIATGEYLLFLHADTHLPAGYAAHIKAVLGQPAIAAGAFRFAIAGSFAGRRFIECMTNWRARWCQLPYGDQGLFLRREIFTELGGFALLPLLEDYDFVRRLRARGKIVIAPAAAITSGRRWRQLGCIRTTLLNIAIIVAYRMGISPARLARWYQS